MKQGNDYADYSYCHVVGQTDVGRKRKANEDNGGHFITINGLVSVVCDGMGGHVGGAVASQIAIETIREFLECQYYDDPREAIGLAIQAANETIIKRAQMQPDLAGMGSTCVLLLVRDGKVYIGHVGDSRIYLIREKNIIQLTKDHSFVQSLVDMGHITKEEAEHHPRKNEITNALGITQMTPATVRPDPIEPQAGDCFLLCSDGLSGMVNDKAIERIVSKQREYTSQQRADILVQTANANGGVDNITVELVEFAVSPAATVVAKNPLSPKIIYTVLIALVLLCAGVCAFFLLKKPSVEKKYIVLSDIEIVAGDTGALFKLTPKDGDNYVFSSTCQDGSVREDLNDVVVDSIKTNLIYSESGEFTIPTKFDDDSVYVLIPCKKYVYRYSAKLVVKPSVQIMNEVKFKSNDEVAKIILTDDKQQYVMYVTGDSAPKIIEAKKFIVSPTEDVKTSTKDGTTTIGFRKEFSGDEIRITFETEEGDKIYIIPVIKSSSASVLPNEDQKKNEHREVPKSEDKKPVVPEEIQDIIVELELTECADKVIEVTTSYVDFDGIKKSFGPIASLTDDYDLGSLEGKIQQTGYDDGKSVKLKFKDSLEAGTYVITFSCKKDGKDINMKLNLNIK